jgi:Tfp pilus assembly protein PilV
MKNEKGFTLLEVVVSIFAIACMSTFIIRMFLVSAQVNQTAYYRDHAAAYAMEVIETFKAEPYSEAMMTIMQADFVSNEPSCAVRYDKNWQPVTAAAEAVYLMEAAYDVLPAQVNALPGLAGGNLTDYWGVVAIDVSIRKVDQGQTAAETLIDYTTSKYTRLPLEEAL